MSRKENRIKNEPDNAKPIAQKMNIICAALFVVVVALSVLLAKTLDATRKTETLNADYRELYYTAAPEPTLAAATARPSPKPAPSPTPAPTPTQLPSGDTVEIDGRVVVLGTPDANTIRIGLPTAPPASDTFDALLERNPEIIGWLKVSDIIDLPVVRRDNEYYLAHDLDGAESDAGALFMDEANNVYPLDHATIIYGHNMKDGTMFGRLSRYTDESYIRWHPFIEFSTLYETGEYIPFVGFHASMDESDADYFEIRKLSFAMEDAFTLFIMQLRNRSMFYVPIDVSYGDELLCLVTCSYQQDNGRFILVCRKLRDGEDKNEVAKLAIKATSK